MIVMLSFCLLGLLGADDNRIVGRVVDQAGQPVRGAAVAKYWSCNGTQKRPDGSDYDLKKPEELALFWGNLGRMEPVGRNRKVTGTDGAFSVETDWRNHFVMAIDADRKQGGIAIVRKGHESEPVEVRLQPLIHLKGRIEGPSTGTKPEWTNVYTMLPEDPERPIDYFRVAHCGSFDARFEMWLPPGIYVLHAYGENGTEVTPWPSITLVADKPEVDLGVLNLAPKLRDLQVKKLKEAGNGGDLTKHYGQRPPRLFAQDSRGSPAISSPGTGPASGS